jgi:hypothetical protein
MQKSIFDMENIKKKLSLENDQPTEEKKKVYELFIYLFIFDTPFKKEKKKLTWKRSPKCKVK